MNHEDNGRENRIRKRKRHQFIRYHAKLFCDHDNILHNSIGFNIDTLFPGSF